jgi:hypothetical protein
MVFKILASKTQGNIIVEQSPVLKIWEDYITELYDHANQPENLEVKTEEEVDEDEKGPDIWTVKWKKLSRR